MSDIPESVRRWRLVLGRYAQAALPPPTGADAGLDQTLGYLYDREYTGRGHQHQPGSGGSLDPSALTGLTWLARARDLFPASTFERMQVDAVQRYGLTELLADPETVESLEPSPDLAVALLGVRGQLDARTAAGLRALIQRVVADIVARLRTRFVAQVSGRRSRRRSPHRVAANFDWRGTIAANLRHWDADSGRLVVEELRFHGRARRHVTWEVVVCVDQSGSMASSLLYSAVCASILAAVPWVSIRLILFDTAVVDLTHLADDPVEVLLTAQLGGGTDIARALAYCEQLITTPTRTVLALISDFEEGGSVGALLATVGRLSAAGVTLLGLAALDEDVQPVYDRALAAELAERGMHVAALTPDHFAEWLGETLG